MSTSIESRLNRISDRFNDLRHRIDELDTMIQSNPTNRQLVEDIRLMQDLIDIVTATNPEWYQYTTGIDTNLRHVAEDIEMSDLERLNNNLDINREELEIILEL